MAIITFNDKVTLDPQPSVARENKVIDDDMNQLKNGVNGLGGTVLWTNANPTQSFSTQDITLNSSNYDEIIFYCKYNTTSDILQESRTLKGKSSRVMTIALGGINYFGRTFTYVSATKYTVSDCTSVQSGSTDTQNAVLVPLAVIGIKSGINV